MFVFVLEVRKTSEFYCFFLFLKGTSRRNLSKDFPLNTPLVLKGGLEPPCPLRHMNLNHACLPFHHFSLGSKSNGGVDRVRTDDPHNAIVMLFQLSYNPIGKFMRLEKSLLVNVFIKNLFYLF